MAQATSSDMAGQWLLAGRLEIKKNMAGGSSSDQIYQRILVVVGDVVPRLIITLGKS